MTFYCLIKIKHVSRKSIFLVLLCIGIGFLFIPQFTLGFPSWDLISLQSDKDTYYNYENIEISASWTLNYEAPEDDFVQLHLMNESNDILWKSPMYNNTGYNEDSFVIHIPDLNIKISNDSSQLFIRFWINWLGYVIEGNTYDSDFLTINIIKANITCELDKFENTIIYGEEIFLNAKFYITNNSLPLINTTIRLKIEIEPTVLYQHEYETNQSGIITVNISSLYHLSIGVNNLKFIILSNESYNNSQFTYKLRVEKIPTLGEIINIKSIDKNTGKIEVGCLYYYYFIESLVHLDNSIVSLLLYQGDSLKYSKSLNTSILGIATFTFSLGSINLKKNNTEVKITIIYNGTQYLHSKVISRTIDINEYIYRNTIDSVEFLYLSSIFSSIIIVGFVVVNKRRGRDKNLADLCIRI